MKALQPQGAFLGEQNGPNYGPMPTIRRYHAGCVDRAGAGVLLMGGAGSGKSDLALRLLSLGFGLVADDQVLVRDGIAQAPSELAGLLEVRGLGIFRLPYVTETRLALVVELAAPEARLPMPARHRELDLPLVRIDPRAASAPQRVVLALDCALGRVSQVAGAFAL